MSAWKTLGAVNQTKDGKNEKEDPLQEFYILLFRGEMGEAIAMSSGS